MLKFHFTFLSYDYLEIEVLQLVILRNGLTQIAFELSHSLNDKQFILPNLVLQLSSFFQILASFKSSQL